MTSNELEHHLTEIERHVRAARGEQIENTPWDFNVPSGRDIKYMREACNISREEFADELGYSHSYVEKVENGQKPGGRQYIKTSLLLLKREWPRGESP